MISTRVLLSLLLAAVAATVRAAPRVKEVGNRSFGAPPRSVTLPSSKATGDLILLFVMSPNTVFDTPIARFVQNSCAVSATELEHSALNARLLCYPAN